MHASSSHDSLAPCNAAALPWIVTLRVALISAWRNFHSSVEHLAYFVISMLKLGFECKSNTATEDTENRVTL